MAKRKKATPAAEPQPEPTPPVDLVQQGRVERVAQLIVDGMSSTGIAEIIAKAYPGEDSTALQLAALNLLAAAGETDAAIVKGFCAAGATEIYSRALTAGEYSQAVSALRLLAAIHGVL